MWGGLRSNGSPAICPQVIMGDSATPMPSSFKSLYPRTTGVSSFRCLFSLKSLSPSSDMCSSVFLSWSRYLSRSTSPVLPCLFPSSIYIYIYIYIYKYYLLSYFSCFRTRELGIRVFCFLISFGGAMRS